MGWLPYEGVNAPSLWVCKARVVDGLSFLAVGLHQLETICSAMKRVQNASINVALLGPTNS